MCFTDGRRCYDLDQFGDNAVNEPWLTQSLSQGPTQYQVGDDISHQGSETCISKVLGREEDGQCALDE